MENLNVFVEEQIRNLPFNREKVEEEVDLDLDIEKIITRLNQVEVYRLTQKEIDDQIEAYPDYYENLKAGDIVYSDGEVAYEMDSVQDRIWEIQDSWRKGEFYPGNEIEYIACLYAKELASKLEQETKPEKQVYKVQAISTIVIEIDGDETETITGCNLGLALDKSLDKSKYFDEDGNFNRLSIETIKMALTVGLGSCINIGVQLGVLDAKEEEPKLNNAIKILTEEPIDYSES